MVLTLKAEDHFSLRISRQMFPCSSTFGWKHGVSNVMSGALYGYVSGNTSLSLYVSPSYYTAVGSCTSVWAWRAAGGGWWCVCVCSCQRHLHEPIHGAVISIHAANYTTFECNGASSTVASVLLQRGRCSDIGLSSSRPWWLVVGVENRGLKRHA